MDRSALSTANVDIDEVGEGADGADNEADEADSDTADSDEGENDMDAVLQVLRATTDEDESIIDEAGLPVDDALGILVNNATEEFGFAPRDVYDGVFLLHYTKMKHATEVAKLNYSKLSTVVQTFFDNQALDRFSHHVVAVYPEPEISEPRLDTWVIDFKSIRIGRKVMEMMRLVEDQHLRNMFHLLYRIPAGSTMAGWFFEAIVHRLLSDGWRSDRPAPQPICMVSDHSNPPTFSTDPSSLPSSTPDASLSYLAPVRDHEARAVVRVNFTHALSNVTLDNEYYTPTASNNPLFDSFTIDVYPNDRRAVISVFQITTSPRHEGSDQGYILIRKIMTRVRKLLTENFNKRKFKIEVAYFLVIPEGGTQHKWHMPVDWDKNTKVNDHRGNAFYLPVPVLVCHGIISIHSNLQPG